MTFTELTRRFAARPPGTDSFLEVKQGAQALIAGDPGHAAAHYLIYGFARSYALLYEDQAVDPAFAEAAKAQLLRYMTRLDAAFGAAPAQEVAAAMNEIVLDYCHSGRTF